MSKITVNYKVEKEEFSNAIDRAFEKLNKKVKIDGFREGKAPRNLFEKKYGKENLYAEAAEELIHNHYHEIMEEGKIIPVVEPRIDLVKADDTGLEVNYIFVTDPEVKLGDYKNLKVKKNKSKVTKEEIEHEISHTLDSYAEMCVKDGKALKGDTVIIDFEGFKDGVAFEGGKAENYPLELGSNSFIPGFEEGLIGLSKGDTKDLELTFPEDYASDELKGQKVTFKVKINDVKTRKVPELDEEFFKDFGMKDINSKEDLEKMIKEQIQARKDMDDENKYIEDLLEAASNNMTIEIDDEIVDAETERMYQNFLERMKMQGITEELYLAYTKKTKEDIKSELKVEALKRIKNRYLLDEIAKVEKIDPSIEDANKDLEEMAKKYNATKEELLQELGDIEVLRYDLKMRKAIELLKENNEKNA